LIDQRTPMGLEVFC